METILNPAEWLKLSVIVSEPRKLEMDLNDLLKKEEFNKLLRGESGEKKEEQETK